MISNYLLLQEAWKKHSHIVYLGFFILQNCLCLRSKGSAAWRVLFFYAIPGVAVLLQLL